MWGMSLLSPSFPLSLSSRFSGPLAQLGPGKPGGPPCRRFHWSWWLPGRPPTTPAGGSLGPNTELAVWQKYSNQRNWERKINENILKNVSSSCDVILLDVKKLLRSRLTKCWTAKSSEGTRTKSSQWVEGRGAAIRIYNKQWHPVSATITGKQKNYRLYCKPKDIRKHTLTLLFQWWIWIYSRNIC